MFQRIEYTEWHALFPKVGFALFFISFGLVLWKAYSMRPRERARASRMPLDD
jgi:cbb3-type cytochrome oxidase subunit 3